MNARFPGSVHDSRTFKKTLGMKFADGFRPLPGGVLISDSAYAASDYLIRMKEKTDSPLEKLFYQLKNAKNKT